MRTSLRLYTCIALVAATLSITAVAVRAQSGRSTVSGVVADESAPRKGKFTVVVGAKVELQRLKLSESKFTATTDDRGVYTFAQIPYGDYVFTVSAPGYRPYRLRVFVDPDSTAFIAVLLSRQAN